MGDETIREKEEKEMESTADEIMDDMLNELRDEVNRVEEESMPDVAELVDVEGVGLSEDNAEEYHPEETELRVDDSEEYEEGFFDEIEEKEMSEEDKELRRKKRRKALMITAVSVFGVILAVYIGFSIYFMNHFYFNTKINGVDFSLESVRDVETYLEEQVNGYTLTLEEADGDTESIVGSEFALAYKEGEELEKLVKGQNAFLWPVGLWNKQDITASVGVVYDAEALALLLSELECMKEENQISPVSASPKFDGTRFVIKEEEIGTQIDVETFRKKVVEYIEGFRDTLDMVKESCYVRPAYTSESKEVADACVAMNKYLTARVTYTFGTLTEVVDENEISGWLSTDENMTVTFNKEAVSQYIQELANKYNTYQKQRSFTSGNGNAVTVEGGDYGWIIDKDVEYQALVESIEKGETVTKEPAYLQTAASHDEVDWGNTYVEVDLTNQNVYLFVDGNIVISGPVVTGKPSAGDATPQGVYTIKYCQKNAVLRGPIQADGSYEWESPVAFWMPFNGGIGLHDAPWQAAFGGERYLVYGSHGCVNLQYTVAETIFNNVKAGTPVVCHY